MTHPSLVHRFMTPAEYTENRATGNITVCSKLITHGKHKNTICGRPVTAPSAAINYWEHRCSICQLHERNLPPYPDANLLDFKERSYV